MIGILTSFLYADWRGAWAARGPFGIITEITSTLAGGGNVWRIIVPKENKYSPSEIKSIFAKGAERRHQRPLHAWGFYTFRGERVFYVPIRQAAWAIYLLHQADIPTLHRSDIVPKYGHRTPQFQNAINRRKTRIKRARR